MNKSRNTVAFKISHGKTLRHRHIRRQRAKTAVIDRIQHLHTAPDGARPRSQREPPTARTESPAVNFGMRVLLRHATTLQFLRSAHEWTDDANQAKDFRSGWRAALSAFAINPRHLLVLYKFDDDRYDLQIPVLGDRTEA